MYLTVYVNNVIFAFVVVSFFVEGWGLGVRDMDKNQQKPSKGSAGKVWELLGYGTVWLVWRSGQGTERDESFDLVDREKVLEKSDIDQETRSRRNYFFHGISQ